MKKRHFLFLFFNFFLGLIPLTSRAENYAIKEISHLEIDSAITPATLDYLKYQFKNVPVGSLILIKMNTPGGLITTTKDIISLIGKQDFPVVIWVTPQGASAASAGAIIAASAHFILMSTGTNMGAATPVGLGEDIKEQDGKAKALNDLKATVRSLGQSRGRPTEPFEEMIENAKSFTDQEALKLKIIDGIFTQETSLKQLLDKKIFKIKGKTFSLQFGPEVYSKNYPPTLGQQILNVLANPSTAYFLFLIGAALLYFEFQAPGGYISGGVGLILLILAAISFQVLPLNWGAFALLIIGIILLVMEMFITSYGVLGLGGVISFVAGSLFLFHGESGFISVEYPILISTALGVIAALALITWYLLKDKKKQHLHHDFFLPLGSVGVVLTIPDEKTPDLQIKVRGEIWRGKSQEDLKMGDSVKITEIDSEKLIAYVKKVHKE
jgi:membrane-bound serine protease (ClpP class)